MPKILKRTAADDCGQRVELLLHRRDLSLEFVEALVHPVDVLPQGRIVEVGLLMPLPNPRMPITYQTSEKVLLYSIWT